MKKLILILITLGQASLASAFFLNTYSALPAPRRATRLEVKLICESLDQQLRTKTNTEFSVAMEDCLHIRAHAIDIDESAKAVRGQIPVVTEAGTKQQECTLTYLNSPTIENVIDGVFKGVNCL
ncbi:MAG: hypothetical protein V4736_10380 [Bdellovibrionota bacterium]